MCCIRRYISKYRPAVILEKKSTKEAMRTLGPAQVEMPSPDKFLKKHSKELKPPESEFPAMFGCIFVQWLCYLSLWFYVLSETQSLTEFHRSCTMRRPPVPARTDIPPMGIQTKRDFIKTVTVLPMKPRPTFVDTSKGHKQLLEDSGLFPKYIRKKVFF